MKPEPLRAKRVGLDGENLWSRTNLAPVAVACGLLCFVLAATAQEKPDKEPSGRGNTGAGVYFNAEASAKDVGLPIYPGARPHKEKNNDNPSARFGLWGGSFAFKLVLVKLESGDSPQKIAAFYKRALAKYGTVLDCSAAFSPGTGKDDAESADKLTCEGDKADPGAMTFKAGTKEKQRIVGIQPNGTGALFQLVYLESPDSDRKR